MTEKQDCWNERRGPHLRPSCRNDRILPVELRLVSVGIAGVAVIWLRLSEELRELALLVVIRNVKWSLFLRHFNFNSI
jgi:hypothetical protein